MYFTPASLIISAVLTILLVGLTFAAMFNNDQHSGRGGYWWISGFILAAAAFICFSIPSDPNSTVRILMNVVFLTAYACCLNGARGLTGRPILLWPVALALILWPIFILAFSPDLDTRYAFFSIIVMLFTAAMGREFYRGSAPHERGRRIAAVICVLHALFYGARAILGPALSLADTSDGETMRLWAAIVSLEALPFSAIIAMLVISISHEQVAHREKTIANTDYLTGIGNRRAFEQALTEITNNAKAIASNDYSLLLLDLDNFKSVNDQFGHARGDELLRQFVHITRDNLEQPSAFWRLGGDEFAILLANKQPEQISAITEQLRTAFKTDPSIAALRQTVTIGISIGSTTLLPKQNLSQLLRQADISLYQCKAQRRLEQVV